MTTSNRHRWMALFALGLSMIAVGLDLTVLNTALPTLAEKLGATNSQLQWFAAGYNLVLAAAILPAGLLGDRIGLKRMLLAGLVMFGAGSVWCGVAGSAGELIAARTALGLGAAVLLPLGLSVLTVLFEPGERQRAIAVMGLLQMVGIPLGPIVAGAILQHFAWGWVFALNVPLVVVSLAAVAALMPPMPGKPGGRVDVAGIAVSALGLSAVTYGLIQQPVDGWSSVQVLGPLIGGILALAALIFVERRSRNPLLDLSLFTSRSFTSGTLLVTLLQFTLVGLLFVLPQFFQAIQGSDAMGTGVRMLPVIGGLLVGMQIANRLVDKLGMTVIVVAGFAIAAIGLAGGTATGTGTGYWFVGAFTAVIGIGTGLALPTAMVTATQEFTTERAGIGSSMLQAVRQFGGVLGVAVLGSLLSAGYHASLPDSAPSATRSSAAAGVAIAHKLGSPRLLEQVRAAFTDGTGAVLWFCAAVALLGIALAILLRTRRAHPHRADDEIASRIKA